MQLLRHTVTLILIGTLQLQILSAQSVGPDKRELYYGLAEGNYLIRDYQGAENSIRQILKIDPEYLPALRLQVRIDLEQGAPEAALEAVESILDIAPDNPQNKLLHALVLGHLGQRQLAKEVAESVLANTDKASPHNLAAGRMLGLFQMAESDWNAAAETFFRIYQADPENQAAQLALATEAFMEKAQTALDANDPETAIAALDEALHMYDGRSGQTELKQRTRLHMMQAQIHIRYGQTESAIRLLETLVRQQSDHLEARITLASLYASEGAWDALNTLIEPIRQNPGFSDIALYFEGRHAFALGRIGTARAKFEEALDALEKGPNPLRPTLTFYRGACFDALGETDQANALIIEALNTGFLPEQPKEAVLAAQVCLRTDKAERAINLLEALALNQSEAPASVWALLARAHEANQQPTLALSAYNQSLSLSPDQADILALRGSLLRRLGDLQGAASDYTHALTLKPDQPGIHYALGLVEFQSGQLKAALNHLNKAAQEQPTHSDLWLLRALLQYTTSQYEPAAQSIDSLLALKKQTRDETVHYLRYLLLARHQPDVATAQLRDHLESLPNAALDDFLQYASGQQSHDVVLNRAGVALTPQAARAQICTAAFWMAQVAAQNNQVEAQKTLLKIAVETERSSAPEYLCAQWQLQQLGL